MPEKSTIRYILESLEKLTKWNNAQKKKLSRHDKELKEIRARLWALENPSKESGKCPRKEERKD